MTFANREIKVNKKVCDMQQKKRETVFWVSAQKDVSRNTIQA
jgi:hypothetical protein